MAYFVGPDEESCLWGVQMSYDVIERQNSRWRPDFLSAPEVVNIDGSKPFAALSIEKKSADISHFDQNALSRNGTRAFEKPFCF
jgi:hypothetical protein